MFNSRNAITLIGPSNPAPESPQMKRSNSAHELTSFSQLECTIVSSESSPAVVKQFTKEEWLKWKAEVIVQVKKARVAFHAIYRQIHASYSEKFKDEFTNLFQLCINIESLNPKHVANLTQFLAAVNELHEFLSTHRVLTKKLDITIHKKPVIKDALRSNEMSKATLLMTGSESAHTSADKDGYQDIRIQIQAFRSKLTTVKNYYQFHQIIQQTLSENETGKFNLPFDKKKIKLKNYVLDFQKYFHDFLLNKQCNDDAHQKQQKHKKDKQAALTHIVPVEFLNVHAQVFNYNLCMYLDEKIKKTQTSISYTLKRIFSSNHQTDKELNFLIKLQNKLIKVENFVDSPIKYLRLMRKISKFVQSNPNISKASLAILDELKWQLYARVFIQNNAVKANGFKMLSSREKDESTVEKFYIEIPDSCKLDASWHYSKKYLRELNAQLAAINTGFYGHLTFQIKNVLVEPSVSKLTEFRDNLQKEISDLLSTGDNAGDSRDNVFKYLNLLHGQIKALEADNLIDQKQTLLTMLKSQLSRYLEFIIYNNSKKYKFDRADLAIINALALNIFPSANENTLFKSDVEKLKEDKVLTENHIEKGEKIFANSQLANFLNKYANKNIQELFNKEKEKENSKENDQERTNYELTKEENDQDLTTEDQKIRKNKYFNTFNLKLKKSLKGYLIAALAAQGDVLTESPSNKAQEVQSIFGLGEAIVAKIPVAGAALKTIFSVTSAQVNSYIEAEYNKEKEGNADAVPLQQVDAFVEYIARKLTEMYEQQISLLSRGSYDGLIESMMARIKSGLSHAKAVDSEQLAQIAVLSVAESSQCHGMLECFNKPLSAHNDSWSLFGGKGYTAEGMLSTCGVVVYNDKGEPTYYGQYLGNHHLYGFRRGTMRDVKEHHLHKLTREELEECKDLKNYSYQLDYTGLSKPTFCKKEKQIGDDMLNQQLEQHEQKVVEIENATEENTAKLKQLEQQTKDQQQIIAGQERTIKILQSKVAARDKKTEKLETIIENQSEMIGKLEEKANDQTNEIAELKQKSDAQDEMLGEMKKAKAEQAKIIDDQGKELAELKEQFEAFKKVILNQKSVPEPKSNSDQPKSVFDFLGNRNRVTR